MITASKRVIGKGSILAVTLLLFASAHAAAQMRPLGPVFWDGFELARGSAAVGMAIYSDQPVARAGVRGRLVEWGDLHGTVRVGKVLFEASGTARRVLTERAPFGVREAGVQSAVDGTRSDTGDFRFLTTVMITDPPGSTDLAFRFGARLPTTDEVVGLERDQTDLFFTLATRWRALGWSVFAEAGLGIFGTAQDVPDQTDPLLYMLGFELPRGPVSAQFGWIGHYDTRAGGPPPGNNHLSELRLRLSTTGPLWIEAVGVAGLAEHSPGYGLELRLGRRF